MQMAKMGGKMKEKGEREERGRVGGGRRRAALVVALVWSWWAVVVGGLASEDRSGGVNVKRPSERLRPRR